MLALLLLRLLLFGAFFGLPGLALPPGTDGSSSHSMRNFYTGVSEPDPGLPQFIVVKYVDDQPIEHYDSNGQRLLPKAPCAKEAARDLNQFWDTYTALWKNTKADFRSHLATLRDRYNQTRVSKWLIVGTILGVIAVVAVGITFFINTWQRQRQGQRRDPTSSPFSSFSDAESAIPLQPQQPPMSEGGAPGGGRVCPEPLPLMPPA